MAAKATVHRRKLARGNIVSLEFAFGTGLRVILDGA